MGQYLCSRLGSVISDFLAKAVIEKNPKAKANKIMQILFSKQQNTFYLPCVAEVLSVTS